MAADKKPTRKELLKSPDEFLTFSEKAINYIAEKKTQFILGAVGFVVVVLLIVGVRWYMANQAVQARVGYEQAASLIPAAAQEFEPEKAKAAIEALEGFRQQYSGSRPALLALMDIGALEYRLGNFENARQAYETLAGALDDNEAQLKPLVLDSLGYSYESLKQYDKAVDAWLKLLALPGEAFKNEARVSLARVYMTKGDVEKARLTYMELLSRAPDTPHAALARIKLAAIEE